MHKTILLTGARSYITLDIAREFYKKGYRVIASDTHKMNVCNYSNCIAKYFVTPSPRFKKQAFIEKIIDIIKSEKIDLIIPTGEETFYLAEHKELLPASLFCNSLQHLLPLHDKAQFMDLLTSMGFKIPKTHKVDSEQELMNIPIQEPYALKAVYSRASQKVFKVIPPMSPPNITIENSNPWIAQEWIEGERYCSYSICHEGQVKALSIYPVEFAINGTSCLTFRHINHPEIINWIVELTKKLHYTGQMGLDFIIRDNELYAIECNPRATSGIHLFHNHPLIVDAFMNQNQEMITPDPSLQYQVAIGMLMYGWKRQQFKNYSAKNFLKTLTTAKDVIYHKKDKLPFLSIPYLFFHHLSQSIKLKNTMHYLFNYDIEWNNES